MKFFSKYLNIALLVAVSFSTSSCESWLEEDNYSNATTKDYITQQNSDQLVVGVYSTLRDIYKNNYNTAFSGTDLFTTKGEIFSYNGLNDYNPLAAGNGSVAAIWKNNYKTITAANTAIATFNEDVEWDESGIEIYDYAIAQVQALRALAYFNLVQQFGGVVLELEETTTVRSDYSRSTEEECYTQIIEDLELSIPNLEEDPQQGRFSKRAAQHLLAKVYLTRGYKSFSLSTDFSKSAQLAELAIGSYDIRSQSYAELFDYENQINDEVLFSIQYGAGGDYEDRNNNKHAILMNTVEAYPGLNRANQYGRSEISVMPTDYFFSLIEDNDTRDNVMLHRAILANEEVTYSSEFGSETIAVGDTIVYYPRYTLSSEELEDRLNRYYVYQPGQYYYQLPTNIEGVIYQYSANINRTNFPIFKKFDDKGFDENEGGYRDTYVYRIAETHLIASEAYLQTADPTNALKHINIVRERATGETSYYTSLTIDEILDERAIELAGEENRWNVLKRTGKLEERINKYNPNVVDHGGFDSAIHLVRPIPSHEMELSNGSLEQNFGY